MSRIVTERLTPAGRLLPCGIVGGLIGAALMMVDMVLALVTMQTPLARPACSQP